MSKRRKRKPWSSKAWVTRGLAAYESEWKLWREAFELSGKKYFNGWVREWLNEAARYEVANAKERDAKERE